MCKLDGIILRSVIFEAVLLELLLPVDLELTASHLLFFVSNTAVSVLVLGTYQLVILLVLVAILQMLLLFIEMMRSCLQLPLVMTW